MSDNTTPEPQLSEQEKLRRERELLLTTFGPSEFGFPSDSGSFAALAEHVNGGRPGGAGVSGYITTDGSDRYHTSEDCPAFQAGRRGTEAQGHALRPVRGLAPGEARSACPECVAGEAQR